MENQNILNLRLQRQYGSTGTNGTLLSDGVRLCKTIELPWKRNAQGLSCIPEGRYRLTLRYSTTHGKHLLVNGVPQRSFILFHPFNNAQKESRGCIAPVTLTTGPGMGLQSKPAMRKLLEAVDKAFDAGREVWLDIVSGSSRPVNLKTEEHEESH